MFVMDYEEFCNSNQEMLGIDVKDVGIEKQNIDLQIDKIKTIFDESR